MIGEVYLTDDVLPSGLADSQDHSSFIMGNHMVENSVQIIV